MVATRDFVTDQSLTELRAARPATSFRNVVLSGLPHADNGSLVPVRLASGQVLADRGAPLRHIHFVETGLVCLMEGPGTTTSPQLAMIGPEGVVGLLELVAGSGAAFATAIVQVHGEAIRMTVPDAKRLLAAGPVDLAYAPAGPARLAVQDLVRQIMETAAVNARDSLVQRLVRWLLMARARLGADEVHITHEVLAAMLGVRRAGVTVAMTALQVQGLIRTGRGRISLLDINGLVRLNARGLQSHS